MRRLRPALMALTLLLAGATAARADATAFIGANTTPDNRQSRGFAIGAGLLLVAFEFEYASNPESLADRAPSLRTWSGNGLLQTPFSILGFQPYVTGGLSVYRERLGFNTDTGVAPNVGGGLKVSLAGPIRLRVDYRRFQLGDSAMYDAVHRLYAGLNVRF